MFMSSHRPRVLLVSPPGGVSTALATELATCGYEPLVAADFPTAKALLDTRPDFLVTDLKLGSYNGLHLAIRAGAAGTPVIVVGDDDPVLRAEAERQNTLFLTPPLTPARVIQSIGTMLNASRQTRRSTRKQVPALDAFAGELQARLLDVSYDGMRLEAEAPRPAALPAFFVVRLPQFNFSCRVQRVWTAVVEGPLAATRCGAAVAAVDAETVRAWRDLVDSMPGLAVSV
jgi:DNA-binding response OmpR family regulator